MCVDDATRPAYVEVLGDERGETAAGFLGRAVAWLGSMGITVERVMSDNGSRYRSHVLAAACRELGLKHLFTQRYRRRINGKACVLASSKRSRTAGATPPSTAPRPSAPQHSPPGSPTTTSHDAMAPSATSHPQLGSPNWNNLMDNYT